MDANTAPDAKPTTVPYPCPKCEAGLYAVDGESFLVCVTVSDWGDLGTFACGYTTKEA